MRYSLALAGLTATVTAATNSSSSCRILPSDSAWPSTTSWDTFNTTVGGRLIATVPIGSPCHEPNYDEAACLALQTDWTLASTHYETSSSVMQEYWANNSCDPFTDSASACTLGNYVSYSVDVGGADDIISTLDFAKSNNIRLVIRNTGHDYFGRSTGAGGLAIWTHNLKDISVIEWSDANYTGKAMKMGAGVQGFDAVEAAAAADVMVLTGECPSVGLAGGYLQGGGHSILSTNYGMAADNLLQYEVVTASGAYINASRTDNSDLFWALAGGGGGTYAIVVSATVKAFDAVTTGGATIMLLAALTTAEKFQAAVTSFHAFLPNMTDLGAAASYELSAEFFVIDPVTVINSNATYVEEVVLGPWLAELAALGVTPYSQSYSTLSYYEHYAAYIGPLPEGHLAAETYQFGSRLIPRSLLEEDAATFGEVLANVSALGTTAAGSASSYVGNRSDQWNSVNPVWRETLLQLQVTLPWTETDSFEDNVALQTEMTEVIIPQFVALTPGGGAYVNEASFQEEDWKETFFGVNYDALLAIKQKWDPDSVFYSYKGVGSDSWTVAANGRMCKA
ncbi:unnamed protein product [Discula destructiva]